MTVILGAYPAQCRSPARIAVRAAPL